MGQKLVEKRAVLGAVLEVFSGGRKGAENRARKGLFWSPLGSSPRALGAVLGGSWGAPLGLPPRALGEALGELPRGGGERPGELPRSLPRVAPGVGG